MIELTNTPAPIVRLAGSTGTVSTTAFTISPKGQNLCAIARLTWDRDNASAPFTSVTWGGIPMTPCSNKYTAYYGYYEDVSVQMFYLVNPLTGKNTLKATHATSSFNEVYIDVVGLSGVNQKEPVRFGSVIASEAYVSTPTYLTVKTEPGDMILTMSNGGGGVVSLITGIIQDSLNLAGGYSAISGHYKSTASSHTAILTPDTMTSVVSMGLSIQPEPLRRSAKSSLPRSLDPTKNAWRWV